jgi:hypothetical protein
MRPRAYTFSALPVAVGLALATLPAIVAYCGEKHGTPAPRSYVSLEVGIVTVWLGMPQADAQQEFAKNGYTLAPPGDSSLVTQGQGSEARDIGQVQFRKGRLIYASRDWPGGDNAIQSVSAILTTFARNGSNLCTLNEAPLKEPGFQLNRLWVRCGERELFLTEETVPRRGWIIAESIGTLQNKPSPPRN